MASLRMNMGLLERQETPRDFGISEWGACMKLARAASCKATEDARQKGFISDPLDSSVVIYTDDPTTALFFHAEPDLHNICKTSAIVEVYCCMEFPPSAFEAVRSEPEWMPRVAAIYMPATGEKCHRCRNYRKPPAAEMCDWCADILKGGPTT